MTILIRTKPIKFNILLFLALSFAIITFQKDLNTMVLNWIKNHFYVYILIYAGVSFLCFDFKKQKLLSAANNFIVFFLFYYGIGVSLFSYMLQNVMEIRYIWIILVGYIFGLLGVNSYFTTNNRNYFQAIAAKINKKRAKIMLFTLVVLSLMFSLLWFKKIGVVPIFAKDIDYARTELAKGTFVLRQLMTLAVPAFFLGIFFFIEERRKELIYFYFALVSFLLLSQGYRTFMLSFWLICVLILARIHPAAVNVKKLLITSIVVLVFVFAFGIYRYKSDVMNLSSDKTNLMVAAQLFLVRPMSLQMIGKVFPTQVPYQYLDFYIRGLGFLQPGTQTSPGMWLKNEVFSLDFGGGGFNPGLLGEFYLSFGIIGIMLGMFSYGLALAIIYNKYSRTSNPLLVVCSSILYLYLLIALSPGVATVIVSIVWYALLTLCYYVLLKLNVFRCHSSVEFRQKGVES